MESSNLVKMANAIGAFFAAEPDRNLAIAGIQQHLERFWEPRMQHAIIGYVEQGGSDLMEIVAEAVRNLPRQKE